MSASPSIRQPGWILGAALVGAGLFMLRYGYAFGFSDQDEFLPLVARILDKDLFLADWFVSMQFAGFSIRWPMALLVALPSTLLPVWSVVFLLHVATSMISATAVARLTHRIFHSRAATLMAVVAVMAMTTRWNPGGNDILHGMLVPSSVAWCLILSAVDRMHARRFLAAGIFLGAASLFHPLLGLQAGGIMVFVVLTWREVTRSERIRLTLPFLIVFVPVAWLLASVGTASPEATTILTTIRAPHHYLPAAFSPVSWVLFGSLIAVATAFLIRDSSPPDRFQVAHDHSGHPAVTRQDRSFLGRMVLVPTGVLLASLLLTSWPLEWPFAIRMQPWALSPLVRVLATMSVVGFGVGWLQSQGNWRLQRGSGAGLADRILPVFGVVILLMGLFANEGHIQGASHPDKELHAWVQDNSASDAIFVVPPSMTGFQFGSSRAQYVSFKSFPFAAEPTLEWWDRLQQIAPVEQAEPGGTALLARLDSSYANLRLTDIRSFVATHDVDYIVRPQPDPAAWQDTEVAEWCSDRWCVFWAGRILTQPVRPVSQ